MFILSFGWRQLSGKKFIVQLNRKCKKIWFLWTSGCNQKSAPQSVRHSCPQAHTSRARTQTHTPHVPRSPCNACHDHKGQGPQWVGICSSSSDHPPVCWLLVCPCPLQVEQPLSGLEQPCLWHPAQKTSWQIFKLSDWKMKRGHNGTLERSIAIAIWVCEPNAGRGRTTIWREMSHKQCLNAKYANKSNCGQIRKKWWFKAYIQKSLQSLRLSPKYFAVFWQFWQFLTILTIFDNFDNVWQFWQCLTIFTIFENFYFFDNFEFFDNFG